MSQGAISWLIADRWRRSIVPGIRESSGSDGQNAHRLREWLPDDQFEPTAQQYCT